MFSGTREDESDSDQVQRPDVQVPEQQSRLSRQPRPAARQVQRPDTQSM